MWWATFDAGNPHVRFDERDLETETWRVTQTPTTERVGNTLRFSLHLPRQISTLQLKSQISPISQIEEVIADERTNLFVAKLQGH